MIAFLFPGQGSQALGMGKDLADHHAVARQTFEQADAALGFKLSEFCFNGPEEKLKLTEITQPAILTVSVAALRVLQEKGITPAFAAGHSLGEYSAHVAAGTLSFEDAVRTVRQRGRYMQEAVPVGEGAMAAILGMPIEELNRVCAEAAMTEVCSAANVNSREQIVISGNRGAVERAAELAKRRGAKRAILLPVSAPFHCSLLKPAQDNMARDLARLPFNPMRIPIACNVDARLVNRPEAARDALIRQVTGAVRWEPCVRLLIAQGIHTFIEVGPGKVLCGLMRQIDRHKTCLNVEDEASLEKAINHLSAESGAA
jgi:[acyl-carrier-protein] S-malonyltransferase